LSSRTLKRHISIAVLSVIVAFVYIDTGSCLPICSSKSRGLADENNKIVTEWK
jgi:hypothetical protein